MTKITHFVGLDVHMETIAIAFCEEGRSPAQFFGSIKYDHVRLLRKLDRLASRDRLLVAYEAGPTGYGLARILRKAKIDCRIVAPSSTPRNKGSRVKTDRLDAERLAHFLRSGDLTFVHIPDPAAEALRDLTRARQAAIKLERVVRHQLSKFLLRHDRRFDGKTRWTRTHLEWIRKQEFTFAAQNRTLRDALHAVESARDRVLDLTSGIEELVDSANLTPLMRALQAFRGIRLVTAATLACEIGDLRRFPSAPEFMGFIGFGVCEDSTGKKKRQFSLTKAGNSHVRRVLVESAWSYRFDPRQSYAIARRGIGVAREVTQIAWNAQKRLNKKYRRMIARGKVKQVAVVAVARELAGFIWSIGQLDVNLVQEA